MDVTPNQIGKIVRIFNVLVYMLIIICAIFWMSSTGTYISVVMAFYLIVFAAILVLCEAGYPDFALVRIKEHMPFLFTPLGRGVFCLLLALLLFGMTGFGIAMGVLLTVSVLGNLYVYSKHPEESQFSRLEEPSHEPVPGVGYDQPAYNPYDSAYTTPAPSAGVVYPPPGSMTSPAGTADL